MAVIEMTKRMRDALAECVEYADRNDRYWYRKASMERLVLLGYATWQRDYYVPTQAGRDYLTGRIR